MALMKTGRVPVRGSPFGFPGFSPIPTFEDLENRMRKMFEGNLFNTFETELPQAIGWMPATDIVEAEKELVLTAELPGLEKKDVEISVENGVLTLRGEKTEQKEEKDEEKKYHLFERSYGAFQRSFTLPRTVDANKITAEFATGVLTVHLPKTAEAVTKGRKIEIAAK